MDRPVPERPAAFVEIRVGEHRRPDNRGRQDEHEDAAIRTKKEADTSVFLRRGPDHCPSPFWCHSAWLDAACAVRRSAPAVLVVAHVVRHDGPVPPPSARDVGLTAGGLRSEDRGTPCMSTNYKHSCLFVNALDRVIASFLRPTPFRRAKPASSRSQHFETYDFTPVPPA